MRVLLDENLPLALALARSLVGHDVDTVGGVGWSGLKNGTLLERAGRSHEVLVTMDRNMRFQQGAHPRFAIVLIRARSNRMRDLLPLVPMLLDAIRSVKPGRWATVGG